MSEVRPLPLPAASETSRIALDPPLPGGLASLRAITLNHRNLGVGPLQHAALDRQAASALHEALCDRGIASIVLATCNRTELYWSAATPAADQVVADGWRAVAGDAAARAWDGGSHLHGAAAAWHLFRVCAGLESLVQGEAEILGQVRTALDQCGGAGPLLRGVGQAAVRAGRMARAETAIGVGACSVASAMVHLVARALPLATSRVLVVGAGATGLKVATRLRALGGTDLLIANRTPERAAAVAAAVGARAIALDDVFDTLPEIDAVVCAVDVPAAVLTRAQLEAAAVARRRRPLLVADISMPAAIEAGPVAGITRVDLADVETFVHQQRGRRSAEVPQVEAILAREMRHLETWVRRHTLRPFVSRLRRRVEAIRQAELARAQGELSGPAAAEAAVLDRLSRRLLDQLLAVPLASLETGALPLDQAHADYLCRLFAIDRVGEA